MLFEDALNIRKETDIDPQVDIEIKDKFYSINKPTFTKKDFINYAELKEYLVKLVSESYGGHTSTYYDPLKGTKINPIFSDYFGQWESDFIYFVKGIKNPKVEPPKGSGYIVFSITSRFIIRFVDVKAPVAVASSKLADIMNLKSNSLPVKIGTSFYRLYFSKDVKAPIFFDGYTASYEQKGKVISFGELLLPISSCSDIFGQNCKKSVQKFSEALEEARTTGYLSPYFSFPRSIFKIKILDEEKIELSDISIQTLINSHVPFVIEKEKGSIRLIDVEDERTKAILHIAKRGLGGINLYEPYRGTFKVFIRVDKDLHEVSKYDGVLASKSPATNSGLRLRLCENCSRTTPFRKCERCGSKTVEIYYCKRCGIYTKEKICPKCGATTSESYINNLNLNESLSYVASRLKITGLRNPAIPKNLFNEPEIPDKLVLRQKNSLLTSKYGIILTPIKLQAGDINGSEIEMPAKYEPLIKEIKSFIYEELASVYGKETDIESIGSSIIIFNKPINAGIELKIKGYRQGNEAIVNPNVLEFAGLGVLDNQAYFALSEDVALNCICPKGKGIIIYKSAESVDLYPVKLDYMRTPIYQQSITEIIKGVINLLSNTYPDFLNERDSISLIKKIEDMFVRQSYICEKCGKKLKVPTLNMRCPVCGSKLRPRFTSSDLNNFILQLNELAENFQASPYKEIIEIYVNNIKNIFRTSSQMSIGDFW
jgi:rRNA maturation protein Nop10